MANPGLQDEKVKVLRGIRTLGPGDVVRGQFNGYHDEAGVKPNSTVETYVALRLRLDSWRWKGVPFYIRAGKSLPVTATEVHVALRHPPAIFSGNAPAHNYLRFRVTPDLVIAVGGQVKKPGDDMTGEPVELLASQESDPAELSAYQELLDDAMHGDPHPLRPRRLCRGGVEDRTAHPRQCDTGAPVRPRHMGPRGSRKTHFDNRRLAKPPVGVCGSDTPFDFAQGRLCPTPLILI